MIVETNNFKIESLGIQEEWVYDIEVDDCHNFFANDILVHNSCYFTLEKLIEVNPNIKTDLDAINFLDSFCSNILQKVINKSFNRLAAYLNSYQNKMIMKREILADVGIVRKKKNYIMRVWDSEGVRYEKPKIKILGLEMIKSSTPMVIRNKLKSTIDIMLDGTNKDLLKKVEEIRKEFYLLPIEDIAFPKSVNNINKWVNGDIIKSGCPINSRGSIMYNKLIDKLNLGHIEKIKGGDKIRFIYLKKPNSINSSVIAFHTNLPKEFDLHRYVDVEKQFEKVFLSALDNTIKPLGWSLSTTPTLDDFFS